ncbi:MAG: DUF2975 domain-containing protein [Oscillospiraceae bacterium]|nr:DUF2975 domain-containing protein [Oscillospiraceae bacterium]
MERFNRLLNERPAKIVVKIMEYFCYFVTCAFALSVAIILRQAFTFTLSGEYGQILLAYMSSPWVSGILPSETWLIFTNGQFDIATRIGLFVMFAVGSIPQMIGFWVLGRVLGNVRKGSIFTDRNARYLLFFGLVRVLAVVLPFILQLIVGIANSFSRFSEIQILMRARLFDNAVSGIAFIVAAYIIHYGIHLQDEADHTL